MKNIPSLKTTITSFTLACAGAVAIFLVIPPLDVQSQPQSDALRKYQEDLDKRIKHDDKLGRAEGQISDDEIKAWRFRNKGNYEDAEMLFLKALAASREYYGPTSLKTASLLNHLGITYAYMDQPEKSEEYFKKSMVTYEGLDGSDREGVRAPADGLRYLLEGNIEGLTQQQWTSWLHTKHPNKGERSQLIAQLKNISDNPKEKATLDPSWGTAEKATTSKLDDFFHTLHEKVKQNWHPPAEAPPKPASVVMMQISDGTSLDPNLFRYSGSKPFDAACLAAVKAGFPYPKIPVDRPKWNVEFVFDQNGPAVPHEIVGY